MDRKEIIQEIVENLSRLKRFNGSEEMEKTGLSKAQAGVMFVVHHHKNITAKEIADFLGVTRSSVTQIIEPLAQKGFIARQADKTDRRIIHITLTAEGRKTVTLMINAKVSRLRAALEVLSDKELATLSKLHRKMAGQLRH